MSPKSGGIKISIGFCRDNLDLNKNAIIENKKKDYWVLDLFDGECYSSSFPGYIHYVPQGQQFQPGDIVGCNINVETGCIEFFKNGVSLGMAFEEDPKTFKKGNLYPLVQLYKCKVSVFQTNDPVMVNVSNPLESNSPTPQQRMEEMYGKGPRSNSLIVQPSP